MKIKNRPSAIGHRPSAIGINSAFRIPHSPPGSILILVMAVLGLLLILGTVFITVTSADRASTANIIRGAQADFAAKSAVNAVVEAVRSSLFDPSGQYLLNAGLRQGPLVQYQTVDATGNMVVKDMPPYINYPDSRYNGTACSTNATVGQYMDLADPEVDPWLTSIVDLYNPGLTVASSYETYGSTMTGDAPVPEGGALNKQPVLRNVARVGIPIPPNPLLEIMQPTIPTCYTPQTGRDFRYPANCRNVPMFLNGKVNPQLVDVDQDGVAEGIWCVLPIGSTGGEQWEAAYKVVDLCGLVNVNTAIRPIANTLSENGTMNESAPLYGAPSDVTGSIASALGRYQTGAEPNGYLYGAFLANLYTSNPFCTGASIAPNPNGYPNIGFWGPDSANPPYGRYAPPTYAPGVCSGNLQMWNLLGVALNPRSGAGLNNFWLSDEVQFRYRGGISGRVPNTSKTSDQWNIYQTGRPNVYTLFDLVPSCGTGMVARPYLTAMSAVANLMIGDPRSTVEGTGNLTANVRDGTLRGTWWANNPQQRNLDATKLPPPKTLCPVLCDIYNPAYPIVPSPGQENAARRLTAAGRQYRVSLDNLVNKFLSSNVTVPLSATQNSILTEMADAFRFSLDGYLPNLAGNLTAAAYVGSTPSGVNPMDQMAAHLAVNLVSLMDGSNTPIIFTYQGSSGNTTGGVAGNITVVGISQFPVIQTTSNLTCTGTFTGVGTASGNTSVKYTGTLSATLGGITMFNPWDTDVSPTTMMIYMPYTGVISYITNINPTNINPAKYIAFGLTANDLDPYTSGTFTANSAINITVTGMPVIGSNLTTGNITNKSIQQINDKLKSDLQQLPAWLVHNRAQNIVIDAWNRDGKQTSRTAPISGNTANLPNGTPGFPKGCTTVFVQDQGLSPPAYCQIHMSKPHAVIAGGTYPVIVAGKPNPPFTSCNATSPYLTYRARWTSPADIDRIPTFGIELPNYVSGNATGYNPSSTITWADQATRCQIAANLISIPPILEPGKIDFLQKGVTIPQYMGGNLTMSSGYDQLTPGQRFFQFFSKVDPLTDGFGATDVNITGNVVSPLGRLEVKLFGPININTAPRSVLMFLPWTNSYTPTGGLVGNDQLIKSGAQILNRVNIANAILNYRIRLKDRSNPDTLTPPVTTPTNRGFLSTAELLNATYPFPGSGDANISHPVRVAGYPVSDERDYRTGNWWGAADNTNCTIPKPPDLTSLVAAGHAIGADKVRGSTTTPPIGPDLPKRDLLFRNVCGMVTTRSDTFAVYAVVRSRNLYTNEVSCMRWVYAIVDRSQCRSSTDAPLVYGPFDNSK